MAFFGPVYGTSQFGASIANTTPEHCPLWSGAVYTYRIFRLARGAAELFSYIKIRQISASNDGVR